MSFETLPEEGAPKNTIEESAEQILAKVDIIAKELEESGWKFDALNESLEKPEIILSSLQEIARIKTENLTNARITIFNQDGQRVIDIENTKPEEPSVTRKAILNNSI